MAATKTHLIALVGVSEVGKTCFLSSLYLKASSSELPLRHYDFGGSKTLYGFEERASYARDWSGGSIPEKLSERTLLQDPRQPGYLHLTLDKTDTPSKRYDILFTDLPGEWFESVIDDISHAERLSFLQRADGILFFVDGENLDDLERRHQEVQTCRILLGRLGETIGVNTKIPFVILVSKIDLLREQLPADSNLDGVDRIVDEARLRGFEPAVVYTASFSKRPEQIENGFGVEDVLNEVLAPEYHEALPSKHRPDAFDLGRSFARYRGRMAIEQENE